MNLRERLETLDNRLHELLKRPWARALALVLLAALLTLALWATGTLDTFMPRPAHAPSAPAATSAAPSPSQASASPAPAASDAGEDETERLREHVRDVSADMDRLLDTRIDDRTVSELARTVKAQEMSSDAHPLSDAEYALTDRLNGYAAAAGPIDADAYEKAVKDIDGAWDSYQSQLWHDLRGVESTLAASWLDGRLDSLFPQGLDLTTISPQCKAFRDSATAEPGFDTDDRTTAEAISKWRNGLPALYQACVENQSDAQLNFNPGADTYQGEPEEGR